MSFKMLNLESLLLTCAGSIRAAVDQKKTRLVRHVMTHRQDGDWSGFDEMLKFDNDLLLVFTSEQRDNKYKDAELILVFVATEGTRCLLRGAFWSKGQISYERFCSLYPKRIEFEDFRQSRGIHCAKEQGSYYELVPCVELSDLYNRLVIDWGTATVSWVQTRTDKEIWAVLPKGFVSEFPGWDKIFISHQELQAIIENPDGNKDWHHFLAAHDGVYVILDVATGKKYVGSACGAKDGKGGIWGRWSGYAKTGDNGNIGLVEVLESGLTSANNFKYSLHHVFPKGTKTKEEILTYESLLKEKLGTRKHGGLNRN